MKQIVKGDFVWCTCEGNERFPGEVTKVVDETYFVKIHSKNNKGSNEVIEAKREQLEIRILGL